MFAEEATLVVLKIKRSAEKLLYTVKQLLPLESVL